MTRAEIALSPLRNDPKRSGNRHHERRSRRIGRIAGCDPDSWGMTTKGGESPVRHGCGQHHGNHGMRDGLRRPVFPGTASGTRSPASEIKMPGPGIASPDYLFGLSRRNTAAGSCRRPFPVRDMDPMLQGHRPGPNGIFSRRPSTAASAVISSRVFRPRIIREKVARNTVRHPDSRIPHRVLRQVRIPRGRFHLRVTEHHTHLFGHALSAFPGRVYSCHVSVG